VQKTKNSGNATAGWYRLRKGTKKLRFSFNNTASKPWLPATGPQQRINSTPTEASFAFPVIDHRSQNTAQQAIAAAIGVRTIKAVDAVTPRILAGIAMA
jgi:hypothetical protein